jgi:hypothetical protein
MKKRLMMYVARNFAVEGLIPNKRADVFRLEVNIRFLILVVKVLELEAKLFKEGH